MSKTLTPAEYFSERASLYAQHRPSYPAKAIDAILEDLAAPGAQQPLRAADIGCGTGISTRLLAARGIDMIGIDPSPRMLDQARQIAATSFTMPEYRIGTGEKTGLDSSNVDLVLCAQSFHWFEPLAALREFHRILRRGPARHGRLALMWNVKDDSDPFTSEYSRVAKRAQADAATRGLVVPSKRAADPTLGNFFTNVRKHVFPNPQTLELPGVLGRIHSASYFPKSDPLRRELEQQLTLAFEKHQRGGTVRLLHRTEVILADRSG